MMKESNKEKISLDALEMISGGTEPNDFDMEYWVRYSQESPESAQQGRMKEPVPHSKKPKGGLFR